MWLSGTTWAALLLLACGLTAASGCGGGASTDAADNKRASPVAGLTPIGAGTGAAPTAAGTLKAVPDTAVRRPFSELTAAGPVTRITATQQPPRPVRLALALDRTATGDELPVVAVASARNGPWELLPAELAAGGRAVVFDAPHFSWFTPLLVDLKGLVEEVKEQFDGLTSGATAEAKAPRCPDEAGARADGWKVSSKGPDTLKWCFGQRSGGQRIVTVVNARRYPLSIAHPGGRTIDKSRFGITDLSSLSAKVSPKLTLLSPRQSVTYAVDDDATFRAEFDGLAQSLYQLQFGVETAVTLLTKFGTDKKGTAKKLVAGLVDSAKCVGALRSLDNAGTIIERCFGDAKLLADSLGVKGAILAAVMTSASLVEFFRSELNALGDQFNGRDRYVLRITHTLLPILGTKDYLLNGEGWGTVAPETIFNGGVPSGLANQITWTGWGAPTAHGTGRVAIYRPAGGYYSQRVPIELRATGLGTCQGSDRPAYTRLLARAPERPGGPFGEWFPWAINLCDYDQKAPKCGRVGFSPNSDDGVFEITAWDIGCADAKRLAQAVGQIAVKPGQPAEYRSEHDGFVCTGYSFDDDLPSISWTCNRETAQVTFKRS